MSIPGTMSRFRIDELSGVDRPAQKGAKAVIMKRDSANPTPVPETVAHPVNEGDIMSTGIIKALGLAEAATEADIIAALTKRDEELAVIKSVAGMSDMEKAMYDGLMKADPAKAKAFLDMPAAERQMACKKAADAEETLTVGTATIAKSMVGEQAFAVMKAQQAQIEEQRAAFAKAQEAMADQTFAKRAGDEFPHLAGSVAERASVLKHLSTAPEAVQKAADAILKAAEATAKLAFKSSGHSDGKVIKTEGGAEAELTKLANELVKSSAGKLSFAKAYDEVAMANPSLYEAATNPPAAD
jgi:hypothetical protein